MFVLELIAVFISRAFLKESQIIDRNVLNDFKNKNKRHQTLSYDAFCISNRIFFGWIENKIIAC